uniref:Uncharacterized protein n=1 Tax=viral metagenome TaxID=1070528 RepID=A0A6C0I7W9_9ZZZZ
MAKIMGCTVFTIAAIILAVATIVNVNKSSFTEVTTMTPGNSLSNTLALENYQDSVVMNVGTSTAQVNKMGAQYYLDLANYLNPSKQNLELAQNISPTPIQAGVPLPGASASYTNKNGNGYVDNLGYLNDSAFAPVAYSNERASQLSKCAKDLPMFAASSLLPKPSSNADNNALSQSASRAMAAFTNLAPSEQIGPLTRLGSMPYGTTVSERPIPLIPMDKTITPLFNGPSNIGIPVTFGSVNNSWVAAPGPNYQVYQN